MSGSSINGIIFLGIINALLVAMSLRVLAFNGLKDASWLIGMSVLMFFVTLPVSILIVLRKAREEAEKSSL